MTQQSTAPEQATAHAAFEPHNQSSAQRLNWLRAGVLGANDGIVSIACIVLGVAAAGANFTQIVLTGVAAIIAGAVSMALGEYVSVSAQRDSERRFIAKEKEELATMPEAEHRELVDILIGYGMTHQTADRAVTEIEGNDPLDAHLRLELGIESEDLVNPWVAAASSAFSFSVGSALPLLAAVLTPMGVRATAIVAVTLLALALTGAISAKLSQTSVPRATLRLLVGGALGLAVTYFAGSLFGAAA